VLSHMIHFCDELHYTSCIHVMCLSFARFSSLYLFIPHLCDEWYAHRWVLSHMIHHCDELHYISCVIIVISDKHTNRWCHTLLIRVMNYSIPHAWMHVSLSHMSLMCDITHACGEWRLIIVMSNRHTDVCCHTWIIFVMNYTIHHA